MNSDSEPFMGLLELSDGTIACWTRKDIKLLQD
jgi:hypothetical protein